MTEGRDHHRSMVPGFPCPTHASAGGTAGHLPPVGLGLPSTLVGGPLYFSLTGGPCSSLPFSRLKVLKPQSTEPWLCLSGGNSQKLPAVSAQSPSRARSRGPLFLWLSLLKTFSLHSGKSDRNKPGLLPPCVARLTGRVALSLTYVYILRELLPPTPQARVWPSIMLASDPAPLALLGSRDLLLGPAA